MALSSLRMRDAGLARANKSSRCVFLNSTCNLLFTHIRNEIQHTHTRLSSPYPHMRAKTSPTCRPRCLAVTYGWVWTNQIARTTPYTIQDTISTIVRWPLAPVCLSDSRSSCSRSVHSVSVTVDNDWVRSILMIKFILFIRKFVQQLYHSNTVPCIQAYYSNKYSNSMHSCSS